jgi:hypothetical protein
MVRDINALARSSKTLSRAIATVTPDNDVLSQFHLLNRPMQAINRCLHELAESNSAGPVPHFVGCGPILGLLSPEVRSQLVQRAIGVSDLTLRAEAIAEFGAGMAHLTNDQHARLLIATMAINFDVGLEMDRAFATGVALAGLFEGQDHLTPEFRETLPIMARSLVGGHHADGGEFVPFSHRAMSGLGQAVRFLPAEKLEQLILNSIHVEDELQQATALGNLGPAMAAERNMNAGGRLVEAALQIADDDLRAHVIVRLATGLRSMEPLQRAGFITAALTIENPILRTHAANVLGAEAEYLSVPERDGLVGLATTPEPGAPIEAPITPPIEQRMRLRLCGLAAGMAHLTREQCDGLARTALNFHNNEDRHSAIGALGQGLAHLSEMRREQLVVSALGVGNGDPGAMIAVITGLGRGAKHLTDNQRTRLIDAVINVADPARVVAKLGALGAIAHAVAADWPA